MELSAIYHRTESEYAYLYRDKNLHIRIRTKKEDIESIILHYGDPFIFMEEFYQDTMKMAKITSDALFDHWQVEVSVDFARIQYLFELKDTEGQSILYGDKGCVENSLENKPFIRLNLSGKSFGFCYESEGLGRIFSENKEVISEDLLFEIAQIFPHQLVFEESGKIYMKDVGDEEVVSVESLTALTDLESLADGRKRLKGYSQEELLQEATAFSGKRYFRSENRTAMLYID